MTGSTGNFWTLMGQYQSTTKVRWGAGAAGPGSINTSNNNNYDMCMCVWGVYGWVRWGEVDRRGSWAGRWMDGWGCVGFETSWDWLPTPLLSVVVRNMRALVYVCLCVCCRAGAHNNVSSTVLKPPHHSPPPACLYIYRPTHIVALHFYAYFIHKLYTHCFRCEGSTVVPLFIR